MSKKFIYNFEKLYKKLNNNKPIAHDTICYHLYIDTTEIIITNTRIYEIDTEAPILYYDDINNILTLQLSCICEKFLPILVKMNDKNIYYSLLYDNKYYFDLYKNNNDFKYVKYINYLFMNVFENFVHTEEYFPLKYRYINNNCDYHAVLIIYNFLSNGKISKENRRKLYITITKKINYAKKKPEKSIKKKDCLEEIENSEFG